MARDIATHYTHPNSLLYLAMVTLKKTAHFGCMNLRIFCSKR